ncbi:MAG: DNA-binding protein [Lachnospiraceae bacterium]|nr:DNA-binding protein [Lachnospiraceae bacterium]
MQYKRFGDTIFVRFDKGEEILEQLQKVAAAEEIRLAEISALGAVKEFTVGVFNTEEKKFYGNHFEGVFEIVSLTGTISTMKGAYYAHLHMSAGNEKGEVFGGHLSRAVISATGEMVIRVIDGQIDRYYDEEIGLNLFKLD